MEETLIKLCKISQDVESHVEPNSDLYIFVGTLAGELLRAAQSFEDLALNYPDLAKELEIKWKQL